MPSQATVTSKTGPGITVTAQVFNPISRFDLQLGGKSVLFITTDKGTKEFDIQATTTLACTIAAGVATLVVSQ